MAGKFKYYHVLTKLDLVEPSFLAEVDTARQEYRMAKREREEMATMAAEDVDVDLILNPPPADADDDEEEEGREGAGDSKETEGGDGGRGGDSPAADNEETENEGGTHQNMDALLEGLNGDHIKKGKKKRRKRGESGGREGKKERREKKSRRMGTHTEGEGDEDGSTIITALTADSHLVPLPELPASEDDVPIVADYNRKRRKIGQDTSCLRHQPAIGMFHSARRRNVRRE